MANIGKIYIDSNDKYKKEESLAKVKEYFRQIGIIPILVDDTLKIYKIRVNKNLDNVINYFDKEYKYKFQRIKPKRKKDNYMYNLWQEVGTEIKNEKAATSDDIWKMFELENEVKRNEFYEKNARIIETDVVYNDENPNGETVLINNFEVGDIKTNQLGTFYSYVKNSEGDYFFFEYIVK